MLAAAMANAPALIRSLQGARSEHGEESLVAPGTHLALLTPHESAHPSATTKTWYRNRNM